jgi:hypothetical protein
MKVSTLISLGSTSNRANLCPVSYSSSWCIRQSTSSAIRGQSSSTAFPATNKISISGTKLRALSSISKTWYTLNAQTMWWKSGCSPGAKQADGQTTMKTPLKRDYKFSTSKPRLFWNYLTNLDSKLRSMPTTESTRCLTNSNTNWSMLDINPQPDFQTKYQPEAIPWFYKADKSIRYTIENTVVIFN